MGIIDARVDNGDHNARIAHSDPPGRRCRHRGRPPLRCISIVGARVCRAVVDIVRYEGLDCLHWGVELGELNVRSLLEVTEEREPRPRHLEGCDSDFVYRAQDLRAEGGVELIKYLLAG